uniref:FkbM family methyltransferase n=1 Tax=Candidatus Planktophila sp. TaxID=2175601 RepID=UPI00404A487A
MNYKVKTLAGEFVVDLTNDHYGEDFWSNLGRGLWEPDTVLFLNQRMNRSVDFIDVGAANGSISLIAAALGARVLAFEAEKVVYDVAKRNFELNSDFTGNIELKNVAISSKNKVMNFSKS